MGNWSVVQVHVVMASSECHGSGVLGGGCTWQRYPDWTCRWRAWLGGAVVSGLGIRAVTACLGRHIATLAGLTCPYGITSLCLRPYPWQLVGPLCSWPARPRPYPGIPPPTGPGSRGPGSPVEAIVCRYMYGPPATCAQPSPSRPHLHQLGLEPRYSNGQRAVLGWYVFNMVLVCSVPPGVTEDLGDPSCPSCWSILSHMSLLSSPTPTRAYQLVRKSAVRRLCQVPSCSEYLPTARTHIQPNGQLLPFPAPAQHLLSSSSSPLHSLFFLLLSSSHHFLHQHCLLAVRCSLLAPRPSDYRPSQRPITTAPDTPCRLRPAAIPSR